MSSELSLMRFLLQYPPHIVAGLEVDPDPGTLYHISPNPTIREFIPRKIQRTMKGEDELVERVCTGVTLLDCFRGYAVTLNDFVKSKAHCAGKNEWLGGYVIYGIAHQGCLVPNPEMAPISAWCEERWLVSHEKEKQPYSSELLGKAFINRLKVKLNDEQQKIIETEILIHVNGKALTFSPGIVLNKGYHVITVGSLEKYIKGQDLQGEITSRPLTEKQYTEQKTKQAELLSYDSAHSAIMDW